MKVSLYILIILILVLGYILSSAVSFKDYKAINSGLSCGLGKKDFSHPVIFVPGIKGSLLRSEQRLEWLNPFDLLSNTDPLIYKEGDDIAATGVFTGISVYKPYYQISKEMACRDNAYVFWYDWRQHPSVHAEAFGELVQRVTEETGKKPSVIAHSMGGLVTHSFLKDNQDKLNKIVYVSVPFRPGAGYFWDVHMGTKVGLNKTIMNKHALLSQPATFALMPRRGLKPYKGLELMDAQVWKDNNLSVFADGEYDVEKLQRMIDEVDVLNQQLDEPMVIENDVLVITSDCHDTFFSVDEDDTPQTFPGDGRVCQRSSFPADELKNKTEMVFCQHHDKQMGDKKMLRAVFEYLEK